MSGNWSKYRLDEIAKLSMGQSPQSKFYNTDGDGLPFFQGKTEFGEYYPSVRQFTSKTTKKAVEGDVLFTVRAPVGELNIANQDCCIGRGLAAIQAKNENENRFLYYILKVNTELFLSRSSGAVYDAISGGDLKSSEIFIPNNSQERIKIAKILSNYDDLIENNLKRIKLLEESARLTYEEWFLRFRIDGKKLDIDTATGLPFEWEVRKISDFVDTASGGTPSRRKPEEFYKDGTIPWVKTKELKNFMIIDADEHITEQGLKKSSAKMFPANTVLLAMYGNTIGEVTFSTFPTSTNQACCAFLVKDKAYLSYFIHQYLLKNKQKILGYRMGAAQENISQQIIKSIEIEIPSESLLQLFGKRLSEKYNLIKSLHTQNQLLKEARDILLPRLMTGMIDTDNMEIAV